MGIVELMQANPKTSLMAISFIISLIASFIHKWTTDQEQLDNLKRRQKELQKKIKTQKDPKAISSINKEMMMITGSMMRASFRSIIFTGVPFFLMFLWMKSVYSSVLSSWIWWYLGFSILFSSVIRKIFNIN